MAIAACTPPQSADVVIRGGTVYDGTLGEPVIGDVVIVGDRIAAVGGEGRWRGAVEIDATGRAVAPGFINMLSWATDSLIEDGLSQADLRQGVTLEVFGEGWSYGPWNEEMSVYNKSRQSLIEYDIEWTTLGEYLEFLERRGVAPNVASFVGATTVRIHELGFENRAPSADELERMKALVRTAMKEGALGVGSSLIYAPAFFAETDELIALARVAAEYDGMYISHIRNESYSLLEALEELITIARDAGIRSEVYHLKAAGQDNYSKIDEVAARIAEVRAEGLEISTDMYTYIAGATGLDAAMPVWVQEGGYEAWAKRLGDPAVRKKVLTEMAMISPKWENLRLMAGDEGTLLSGFKNEDLRHLRGKTLKEVAEMRGTTPAETVIDLVIEDGSRVEVIYFLMSEENIRKKIKLPYMSFGSDAGSPAPEGVFLESNPHPRAYGTFARLLGKYVRDEGVIPLTEAVHRLTGLSADKLRIRQRGYLRPGYFADVVVFDPATIGDLATFEEPHQYSVGV
ncbi:MAG: amidohydrolase family protein, partial [Acidobacteria bacterium]|nr:amidohydrolase family protein [Acidobacteriota bacterium]